jgi:hypothetical protein
MALAFQDIERIVEEQIDFVKKGSVSAFRVDDDGAEGVGIGFELESGVERLIRPEAICEAVSDAIAERHEQRPSVILLLRAGALPAGPSASSRRDACSRRWRERSLDTLLVYEPGAAPEHRAPSVQPARALSEL